MRRFTEWLNHLNATTWKSFVATLLWVLTGVATLTVVLLAARAGRDIMPGLIALYYAWLMGLGAFSGITGLEFYGKRKTDRDYAVAQAAGGPSTVIHQIPGGPVTAAAPAATATVRLVDDDAAEAEEWRDNRRGIL